jgi:hypothetical protein
MGRGKLAVDFWGLLLLILSVKLADRTVLVILPGDMISARLPYDTPKKKTKYEINNVKEYIGYLVTE